MNWLIVAIVYYLIGYVLIGGVLVTILEVATWDTMVGWLFGLMAGHYLGRSASLRCNCVSNGYTHAADRPGRDDRST